MVFLAIMLSLMVNLYLTAFFNKDVKVMKSIQQYTLLTSVVVFLLSLNFLMFFDNLNGSYQFLWVGTIDLELMMPFYLQNFSFGVDGISIFFLLLSTFLIPLCLLTSWKFLFQLIVDYCFYFILLELFLMLSFLSLDIMTFFIFFESMLIPMFFMIGIWGSRQRRVSASMMFFLYTLFGSIFLFFSLLIVYYDTGTTSFSLLSKTLIEYDKQLILWLFLFFSFSVKIPTVPVHTWLPEAHVEAPTAGSVMLAGILLKLGGYGFLRVLLPIFSKATIFYAPLVDTFALISIIYASLTTIRQVDLKSIIAYSSVAHMNLVVLGIFSGNIQGVSGAMFLMMAHGIVSSGLFFLIGVLYDNYHTRLLFYYGGLIQTMPLFSSQLLILCLANTGLPGSCNFMGELMVFVGLIDSNFFVTFISVTGVILSVLYSIFFFNSLVFGNLNLNYILIYKDITYSELFIMGPLVFFTIWLGFFPYYVFDIMLSAVSLIVEKTKCF